MKQNERYWYELYEKGQKLVFKSNCGDFDTIIIVDKIHNLPSGRCNYLVDDTSHEFIRIDYKIKKDSFKVLENYLLQLKAEEGDIKSLPILRLLNMECGYVSGQDWITTQSIFGKREANTLIKFNKEICGMNFNGRYGLTEFTWDKTKGLVEYRNDEDEVWTLLGN